MSLNDVVNWHEFFENDDEDEEERDDLLFELYLKQEIENPLYEKNRELLDANYEMVQANVELRRKCNIIVDEKTALLAELLELRCQIAVQNEQLNGSREKEDSTIISNASSALGDSFLDEINSRPNSAEPEIVVAKMKIPGRRTTAFKLDFEETADFKSSGEAVVENRDFEKMKVPGRRTTRFALSLDDTNDDESESPSLEKPAPENLKKSARSKARKSKYRQTMHTVEEDFETEVNKVPTPDLGLIKKQVRKTATFTFEFDETIDGSPIRSPRSTKNSPKIKNSTPLSPLVSPKAPLESEEEKDSPTPGRMRRRFEKRSSRAEEKKENLKAEMRIPGRRTTTFGFGDFDLDESNESEGVDSYAVEEPFSPSPKKRESRSAKRQKFSTDAVNNQATTSSASFFTPERKRKSKGELRPAPSGGLFADELKSPSSIVEDSINKLETNENEICATKKKGKPRKSTKAAQSLTPLQEKNLVVSNICERVSRRARKVVSYKEPSTGSKLRRGDAISDSSLYSSWSPKNSVKKSAKKKPKKAT
ncbi:unnamed protein product [Oikopleura dioica]|uniref:Shugoshin C-terminal domain-containing protein n=1 Tax=Oikopleura dioica TaxID=34765 RepID=E4YFX5_OIKDI|nr:unnamed protein product [Oikopleura dioica]